MTSTEIRLGFGSCGERAAEVHPARRSAVDSSAVSRRLIMLSPGMLASARSRLATTSGGALENPVTLAYYRCNSTQRACDSNGRIQGKFSMTTHAWNCADAQLRWSGLAQLRRHPGLAVHGVSGSGVVHGQPEPFVRQRLRWSGSSRYLSSRTFSVTSSRVCAVGGQVQRRGRSSCRRDSENAGDDPGTWSATVITTARHPTRPAKSTSVRRSPGRAVRRLARRRRST